MQTEAVGSAKLAVVAGDVLALRGAGLAASETWALLCQAAQALQDLFLSNGGVVGGSGVGPVVTPHTLELTQRGRVTLQLAPPETARAYLPPEYRLGRVYSDTDSEKMWMYSLGRALLDTTPRVAALTGSVSVSPSSALQSVLAAMTEPDPRRRASLMNLLDVISEYCRTRLQSKPFTHIVMDMYREVVRSPQYAARKRAAFPDPRAQPPATQRHHQHQSQHQVASQQQSQQPHQQQHQQHQHQHQIHPQHQQQQQQTQHTGHFSKHQVKGALFKAQSRNSRSHPNLISLAAQESTLSSPKPQFQSQVNIQTDNVQPHQPHQPDQPHQTHQPHQPPIHHSRTSSQPEYSDRVQRGLTGQARSVHNLAVTASGQRVQRNPAANVYNDPIYALPVKPFLSSQDVRVNGLSAKSNLRLTEFSGQVGGRAGMVKNAGSSQPNIAHLARIMNGDLVVGNVANDVVRTDEAAVGGGQTTAGKSLHRQYSNPQLPTRNPHDSVATVRQHPRSNGVNAMPTSRLRVFTGDNQNVVDGREKCPQANIPVSSIKSPGPHGPVPPKPPRLITSLKRSVAPLAESHNGIGESVAPEKPPRATIKNGPRARRGKPVQRAPSRLYRAIGGPTRCFNKTQCVGPEFVVRANQPPKILCVGDTKASSSGRIVVILLTGQRIEVTCDPQKITAGELFQAIVQAKSLEENFTLGLAALLAGDFAMLPPETKLNKVAPPGWLNSAKSKGTLGLPTSFMLYLRFRFFLPSLRGIRSWISKHLLYLQIRRCILEQQLVCTLAQLVNLTGLALQAEFGNYSVNEHGRGDYFLLEHYIPESLILHPDLQLDRSQLPGAAEALRAKLHQAHRERRGLEANNAEEMFVTQAQSLVDYGSHFYIATVDNKELEKIVARLNKCNALSSSPSAATTGDVVSHAWTENIYQLDVSADDPIYGKIDFNHVDERDDIQRVYGDQQTLEIKGKMSRVISKLPSEDIYAVPITPAAGINIVEANNNSNSSSNNNNNKLNKSKKSESNVWLAIHAQGLKLFDRGGRPRDRTELVRLQWRDIQTLSYSKNALVVYTRLNGKRCKFKLRMDHKKSYYAFKLTSLHHQFFLKLRSEIASLHELAKEFGTPVVLETSALPSRTKLDAAKSKLTLASCVRSPSSSRYPMQLEEYQNKENENPQKLASPEPPRSEDTEPVCYTPEDDALYAQVNARLEPEGASRDTEDECDRPLIGRNGQTPEIPGSSLRLPEDTKIPGYTSLGSAGEKESPYSTPKPRTPSDVDRSNGEVERPEELYAAINKTGMTNNKTGEYAVPEETWDVASVKKNLHKEKTSSLPNYGTPRQSTGFRTPSLPRRLGVKMGTRAIYSSLVQRDSAVADDLTSLSLKSDTASSMQSVSVQSTESPLPEAYVLNEDIHTDDETFRIGNDVTMSASLAARLEELSFAEERILQTIQLERGHGGSIGLQVTEGNDGGVYVQAVSVGGSADMAGNVNKGDRIVAINGQSLLNLRYDESLKLLQSSPETVELVLSQITNRHGNLRRYQLQEPVDSSYLQNLRFEIASEVDTSNMTTKWLSHGATDVASVQNTSSAYSSAASSAMGNHNTYLTEVADANAFNSAMEIGAPPPVPPRRRKRKSDVAPARPTTTPRSVKKTVPPARLVSRRPDREPRSLPPPPPVPRSVTREGKPEATNIADPHSTLTGSSTSAGVKIKSVPTNPEPPRRIIDDSFSRPHEVPRKIISDEPPKILIDQEPNDSPVEKNYDYRNENRSGRSSPMPDTNPRLLFTFRDFESVMNNSGISDRSHGDQYETITTPDRSAPTSFSFLENSPLDEDDDDVDEEQTCFRDDADDIDEGQTCFRVTTTDVPFEKCVGSFTFSIDSPDFQDKFHDTDHYIFEDYMDRSKRINARPTFLFDDDTFEQIGRNDATESTRRTATRVRFVIESPSSSTSDLDNTGDSLGNVESIVVDDGVVARTSVIITEITETDQPIEIIEDEDSRCPKSDRFGDVPFSSILDDDINRNADDERIDVNSSASSGRSSVIGNVNEETAIEEPRVVDSTERKNRENRRVPRSSPSPRFMSPVKPIVEPIPNIEEDLTPKLPKTYDPRDEGFVGRNWGADGEDLDEPKIFDNFGDRKSEDLDEPKIFNDDVDQNPEDESILQPSPRTSSEGSRAARKAFVNGKLNADSSENDDPNPAINDDASRPNVAQKPRVEKKKIFIDSALRDFIDDDEDFQWNESSDEEDGRENIRGVDRDDDRESSKCTELVNKNSYQPREISIDGRPRLPAFNYNEQKFANEVNDHERSKCTESSENFRRPDEVVVDKYPDLFAISIDRRNEKLANEDNDEEWSKCTESWNENSHRATDVVIDKYPRSLKIDADNSDEKSAEKEKEAPNIRPKSTKSFGPISGASPSTRSKDDVNWLPVSVRRNSFLENMLTESKALGCVDEKFPCSIIAAHPKPTAPRASSRSPASSGRQVGVTRVSENVDKPVVTVTIETVPSGSPETSANQLADVTGVKISGPEPDDREGTTVKTTKTPKTSNEARSDVLTELLSNFGAIKLKSVDHQRRDTRRPVVDDEKVEREIRDRWKEEESDRGRDKDGGEVWAGLSGTSGEKTAKVEETTTAAVKADSGSSRVPMTSMTTTKAKMTKALDSEEPSTEDDKSGGTDDRHGRDIDVRSGALVFEYGEINSDRDSMSLGQDCEDDDSIAFNRSEDADSMVLNQIEDDSRVSDKNDDWTILNKNEIADSTTLNKNEDAVSRILNNSVGGNIARKDGKMVSVDNCAIARKCNSPNRRNNNDNNAMTPVDVSNDQKPCDAGEATTIVASGSVRSFVELYENQRDQTSKNSKSNYSVPPARITTTGCSGGLSGGVEREDDARKSSGCSSGDESARASKNASGNRKEDEEKIPGRIESRGFSDDFSDYCRVDGARKIVARNFVADSVKTRDGILSTNDDAIYGQSANRRREISGSAPVAAKRRSLGTRDDVNGPRTESKRYVTFYNDCEATRSDCDEGAKTTTKRRAPERPGDAASGERDCAAWSVDDADWPGKSAARCGSGTVATGNSTSPTPTPRSEANLIRTQTQREVDVSKSDTINPGTATSVPKPDVSHPRQPYVFLCRV